jgi:hypothetical protein
METLHQTLHWFHHPVDITILLRTQSLRYARSTTKRSIRKLVATATHRYPEYRYTPIIQILLDRPLINNASGFITAWLEFPCHLRLYFSCYLVLHA